MKLKLLLLFAIFSFMLSAQEPYRDLLITEVRMGWSANTYLEITNMGDKDVQLSEWKLGRMYPWSPRLYDIHTQPWVTSANQNFMLPQATLKPGQSWVVSTAYNFPEAMYQRGVLGYEWNERTKEIEFWTLSNHFVHFPDRKSAEYKDLYPEVTDSVTPHSVPTFQSVAGGSSWFLEHHFAEGDSAVVDQFGGTFTNNGRNLAYHVDVAGVTNASRFAVLLRKYSIKTGQLDFLNTAGTGLDDSDWMPYVMETFNFYRATPWTIGNHGPYVLDENTLEPKAGVNIDVDFAGKKIAVPWGIRRLDDIMRHMEYKPGVAWNYHLNAERSDSLYRSARTGDKLTVFVFGNTRQQATFDIVVQDPAEDANIVVPMDRARTQPGRITLNMQDGELGWPRITTHDHGTDTITGTFHGLPYAMRVDTLMKYLEFPSNATGYEVEWVDGASIRADFKNGDKLKVIAQDGSEKEYFIQLQGYSPNRIANLSSISWPDIPEFYKGIMGWIGDTIPSWTSSKLNYRVQIPMDVEGIPALIAKTHDLNASIEVNRPVSLEGSPEDRTMSFTVTAEDNITSKTYNVVFDKEKDYANVQPYVAEPFLSEFVHWDQWANQFAEIANPGNQPLDLSNYLMVQGQGDPASVIEDWMEEDDWLERFRKYVPGYKWVSETDWSIQPGILVPDLGVNAIVAPGDVFTMGHIRSDANLAHNSMPPDYKWPIVDQLDVQFNNYVSDKTNIEYTNPWGEEVDASVISGYNNTSFYLFKIKPEVRDSIHNGLKPVNDPRDFELIDAWGMADNSPWIVNGELIPQLSFFQRKPHIKEGNPEIQSSFGTNDEDSEWIYRTDIYFMDEGFPWPVTRQMISYDIGTHFMYEPTEHKSTITSLVYKVSEGYGLEESIRGITVGTTVGTFLSNLIKANEDQSLTLKSADDGSDLGMDDLLSLDDVLVVVSADGDNTSQYILNVSEDGLSPNAVLTSDLYVIDITSEPKSALDEHENDGSGIVSGFDYGTQLRTIVNNVNVPLGATMNVIDGKGAYVPMKMLNFDTTYVNVTVNPDIYFDVVAEDGLTRIVYQLQPTSSESDALLLSDVYTVYQQENLVHNISVGTSVNSLLGNVTVSLGATVKLVDKLGGERTEGTIVADDKLVVTSANESVTNVYHLSMLRTHTVPESGTYLAYVLSDVYAVDQLDFGIAGATTTTDLADFYTRIRPATGATAVVVDAGGMERTSGDLVRGDMLKVTSADGKIEVMYELHLTVVSVKLTETAQIEIYPNPTNGKLNIKGVERGNRIQVFNATGAIVRDMKVQSNLEVLSLNDQPSGIYLIVISNDNQMLGRYKVSKR